jgi:hypothetical protein
LLDHCEDIQWIAVRGTTASAGRIATLKVARTEPTLGIRNVKLAVTIDYPDIHEKWGPETKKWIRTPGPTSSLDQPLLGRRIAG